MTRIRLHIGANWQRANIFNSINNLYRWRVSKSPKPRSAAYNARSVSELAEALKHAESQLDLLGDALDAATAVELRLQIARASHELERLGRHDIVGTELEIPPFWRKLLEP